MRPIPDRKASYNPVGTWVPAKAHEAPLEAYEVSKAKRILQLGIAVSYSLLAAGIIFGYAALKPVLIDQRVYQDRCRKDELVGEPGTCYAQDVRLNFMFAVAAVGSNLSAVPVGILLDRYGPRVASIVGSALVGIGSLIFGLASRLPFDGYIPGYLLMALGGPFLFMPSIQLSNAFPDHSGMLLSLLTGAFDASSAVFLIYRIIYEKSHAMFTPDKFFLGYTVVPAAVLAAQVFLMPKRSYKTISELVKEVADETEHDEEDDDDEDADREERIQRQNVISEVTELLGGNKGAQGIGSTEEEEKKREISGVWGAMHGDSALHQVRSAYFILMVLLVSVQMLRINYFVATVRTQYANMLGDYDAAVRINDFFDIAFPVGGLVAVPLIGVVFDYTSTLFMLVLLVIWASIIGVLGLLKYNWAAYANIILFVMYRPFFYTAIADYSAKIFGFQTFGRVLGLIMCLAGLVNFSQYGLDAITHHLGHDDPVPVNLALLVLALIPGIVLVTYVWRQSFLLKRQSLEAEAEDAPEIALPVAVEDEQE